MTSQNNEVNELNAMNDIPHDLQANELDAANRDVQPTEHSTQTQESQGTNKKRPLRSNIWEFFTCDKQNKKATCNYCKREYVHTNGIGTSTLWNHAKKCPKNPSRRENKNQPILSFERKKEGSGTLKTHTFNVERCRQALANMIILDEYPFRCVEGIGFIRYSKELEPRFNLPSRWTVARDCIKVFKEERKKLKLLMKGKRICMTTDCWSSNQKMNYMCLTAHWIDDEWKLHKKIINFHRITSHKGKVLGKAIEKCMLEWGIDSILTLTADNASANDLLLKHLKEKTTNWKSCISSNEFLHVRCSAHILNLVVKDGLKTEMKSIEVIRNAVKYVRASASRFDTFRNCVEIEKIESKCMPTMDVDTRWNSTYLMLESAVNFEKAFERLEEEDKGFKIYFEKLGGPPTKVDWTCARVFIQFLKLFYDCTLKFSSSLFVTSNLFFREMLQVHDMLKWMISSSNDEALVNMAIKMKSKYEKYWGSYSAMNYLLFVCVALDPRYKMKYVRWNIKHLCDNEIERSSFMTSKVEEALDKLFRFYELSSVNRNLTPTSESRGFVGDTNISVTGMDMYAILEEERSKQWEMDMMAESSNENRSELELYMLDRIEAQTTDFDILLWWKVNTPKYPILSKMARELLAVPVSTVSSESAFSTGSRVLDTFRSSLLPKIVECLICSQNWLKATEEPIHLRDMLLELEKYEDFAEDLDAAMELDKEVNA